MVAMVDMTILPSVDWMVEKKATEDDRGSNATNPSPVQVVVKLRLELLNRPYTLPRFLRLNMLRTRKQTHLLLDALLLLLTSTRLYSARRLGHPEIGVPRTTVQNEMIYPLFVILSSFTADAVQVQFGTHARDARTRSHFQTMPTGVDDCPLLVM